MCRYITVAQLSERTGYKVSYIRKMCERKMIPFFKPTNGRLLFDEKEIEDFFVQSRRETLQTTK